MILTAHEIFGDVWVSELPKYGMVRFPKIVGYTLLRIGIRPGNKTRINPAIPSFIRYGDENVCKSAIGQIIDDEGNVDLRYKKVKIYFSKDATESSMLSKNEYVKNWAIYGPNLLKDSIFILKRLKIKTSPPYISRIRVTKDNSIKID